ncbi:MAG: type II secretion system protein GspM [Casimicrobiaceae bacterium]
MATLQAVDSRARLSQWWQLRSRVERLLLSIFGVVVIAAIAWLVVWQPMRQDSERLARQVATQRAALATARLQADDIASLSRNATAVAPRDARADLDAALAQQGLKATTIDRGDGDRWRVNIDAIGFDVLLKLVEALQRDAHLRAVDLTATARVEPGQVRAELVLAQ